MIQSESIAKIYPALIKALGELDSVKNNAENTHFKAKYSTLSATQDLFRPILAKNELGVIQSVGMREKTYVVVTRLIHTSGEFIEDTIDLMMSKQDMQGLGSAITYSKRYMVQALLNMSGTNDDDDGNDASGKEKKEKSQNQNQNQSQKKTEPQREKQAPKDIVYPFDSSIKNKKIGDVETATLEKARDWLKGEIEKDPKPQDVKRKAFIYSQVKAVLFERSPKKDDIPENMNQQTGEFFDAHEGQPMPDYEGESQAPKGPQIDDYVIPKGTLGLFADIEGRPLKSVTEGELREAIKIIDAEAKKGPREGVSVSDLFNVRSKIVEFFKSMDVTI